MTSVILISTKARSLPVLQVTYRIAATSYKSCVTWEPSHCFVYRLKLTNYLLLFLRDVLMTILLLVLAVLFTLEGRGWFGASLSLPEPPPLPPLPPFPPFPPSPPFLFSPR